MVKETDVTRAAAPSSRHKFTADRSDMAHRIKREMIANPAVKIEPKEPPRGR